MALTERDFFWKNPPAASTLEGGRVTMTTAPATDFWQRTHYGFRADSGHCLLTKVTGNFTMTVTAEFDYRTQFDQCGVVVYESEDTWMKGSIERENDTMGRLGSVGTNHGWSDWATADIPAEIRKVSYRLHRRGDDFLLERAFPGEDWAQMRIFHLHGIGETVSVGVYACSPKESSFTAVFSLPEFAPCCWEKE